MGIEIDLLRDYPKSPRDLDQRLRAKSEESRRVARRFDKEYFDGDRNHGYGGFEYNPRFWKPVIPAFVEHFGITSSSSVLDVGCAKGFMIADFLDEIPELSVTGVDISDYAIANSLPRVQDCVKVANATSLPFADDQFDFVISINTVHNLGLEDCATALREIQRVAKVGSFVTVDAYRNESEKERMEAWNLTALTMMSTQEWEVFFRDVGYSGDYFWFIP